MLSAAQTRALAKLAEERRAWFTPYDPRVSRGTLNSLVRRSLADRRNPPGSLFFPRSNTLYRITDLGWETYQKIKQVTHG